MTNVKKKVSQGVTKKSTLTNQTMNKPTDYLKRRYSFLSEKQLFFQLVKNTLLYVIQKFITS